MLRKTLDWLERKVVGNLSRLPALNYAFFKFENFIRSGTDLNCDKKIAEHQLIAEKWYSKRHFILTMQLSLSGALSLVLGFFTGNISLYPLLFSEALSITIVLVGVLLIFLLFIFTSFTLNYYRKKYIISILVDNLISIISYLYMLTESESKNITIDNAEEVKIRVKNLREYIEKNIPYKRRKPPSLSPDICDLSTKRKALSQIEDAAKYIEYYIPRHLRSGDIATDDWFKDSMKCAAASLREKKKWILTPMEDTYDNLIIIMISTLVIIVNGNWHALERLEPEKLTRPSHTRLLLFFLLRFAKMSLIAVFPLLFLIIFQQTPFAVTGAIRDYAFIATLLWFGFTILISFDSSIGTKISFLKDLKSLLPSDNIGPK